MDIYGLSNKNILGKILKIFFTMLQKSIFVQNQSKVVWKRKKSTCIVISYGLGKILNSN